MFLPTFPLSSSLLVGARKRCSARDSSTFPISPTTLERHTIYIIIYFDFVELLKNYYIYIIFLSRKDRNVGKTALKPYFTRVFNSYCLPTFPTDN